MKSQLLGCLSLCGLPGLPSSLPPTSLHSSRQSLAFCNKTAHPAGPLDAYFVSCHLPLSAEPFSTHLEEWVPGSQSTMVCFSQRFTVCSCTVADLYSTYSVPDPEATSPSGSNTEWTGPSSGGSQRRDVYAGLDPNSSLLEMVQRLQREGHSPHGQRIINLKGRRDCQGLGGKSAM
jgi:hypothetical protein